MIEIITVIAVGISCIYLLIKYVAGVMQVRKNSKNKCRKGEENIGPQLKQLTDEEIESLHRKGLLSPAEQVEQWELRDLCVPSEKSENVTWRCIKFKYNCHECLIDYYLTQEDCTGGKQISQ